jgi:hypothetical protein
LTTHRNNIRVLVTGGRDYENREAVFKALQAIHEKVRIDTIIHGKARGADALADEWASSAGVTVEAYPAEWNKYGKAAGPIRNREMLLESTPDLVVAFPGGKGTKNMVDLCKKFDYEVMEVS